MQITELRGRGERAGPKEFSQGRGRLLIASSLCPSKSPSPTPHLVWKISLDIKPCVLGTKSLLHTGASQELHTHHSMESSHQEYEDYCPHMRREDTCPERLSNLSRLHYGLAVHSCFSRPPLCSALCPGAGSLSLSQRSSSTGGRKERLMCLCLHSLYVGPQSGRSGQVTISALCSPPQGYGSCGVPGMTKFLQAWRWEQCCSSLGAS